MPRLPGVLLRSIPPLVAVCVWLAWQAEGRPATRSTQPASAPAQSVPARAAARARPNVVFVLTDDLTGNLLRFMPHVQAMQGQGATFENYFVADSLCCPSRASILTGKLPHNTGVLANSGLDGGFAVFFQRGEERHTFAFSLRRAGYLTALMGKYLNGYLQPPDGSSMPVSPRYVPPGWDTWDVGGWGYGEFDYVLNESGVLHRYGHTAHDYLTDVLARKGVRFIRSAARQHRPFFLELSTFAPHAPFTPAPRNEHDFPHLRAPRTASFNVPPTHPPPWLRARRRLTRRQTARIDRAFRLRARSVEAVDRMIGAVEVALRASGVWRNTYIVFSSDNGLHMGEYRLMPGKGTAFDTDIRVPLVVVGPGIPHGIRPDQLAGNIDLAETFAALGGSRLSGDGRSLLPILRGDATPGWRNAVLVEHHGSIGAPSVDPDLQAPSSGHPGAYHAIRTSSFLYVEYADGTREFYDLRRDPAELHNIAGRLTDRQLRQLHRELDRMRSCSGPGDCWRAMHLPPLRGAQSARSTA